MQPCCGPLRPSSCFAVLLVLLVLLLAPPPLAAQSDDSIFYLVVELDGPHPRVVSAQLTPRPHPLDSQPSALFHDQREDVLGFGRTVRDGVAVTVQDAKGEPVFKRVYPVLTELHGEFHGDAAPKGGRRIERFQSRLRRPLAVVRVPAIVDSRILLEGKWGSALLESVDVLSLIGGDKGQARSKSASVALKTTAQAAADNRVDLLILGDGYTSAQQQQFLSDASLIEQQFLGISPYFEYRNYVRVTKLFLPSPQSGADHPPYNPSCVGDNPACCADPDALTDPLSGTYVSTALGSRFCAFNVHRLLVPDVQAVLTAASAFPSWDEILVIANDTTYGGSGGASLATISLAPSAVDVARHEYGHSFTGLADEYDDPFPGFPACSDRFGPVCEANVTEETSSSLLKWSPWVGASTPIPTPEGQFGNSVGLFEGARYLTTGMFRPRDTECLMHFLGKSFCEICRQEYVLSLYRGGWGDPVAGIETIEPGSPTPAAASFKKCSGSVTLAIQALQPVSGPAAAVQWRVNGNPIPGATSPSFLFASTVPQIDIVSVSVTDTTLFVHPEMANGLLTSSYAWTVETASLPASVVLQNHSVAQSELHEACNTINAGPAVDVESGGSLTLRAGTSVTLSAGFKVESGGQLKVGVGPIFPNN